MAVISDSGYGKLGLWNREEPGKDLFIFKQIIWSISIYSA